MAVPVSSDTDRRTHWRRIRDTLADDLAAGRIADGCRLPSEQELARRFGVHRNTVRHALQALAATGSIRITHGRGSFANLGALRYRLGARTSFTDNVARAGRAASRRIEATSTVPAPAELAADLVLETGAPLVRVVTIAAADDTPLALSEHNFPAARLPDIAASIERTGGISDALADAGVPSVRRARTRIVARPATDREAAALAMAPSHPVLVTAGLDVDAADTPVQVVRTTFCASRVELEVGACPGSI